VIIRITFMFERPGNAFCTIECMCAMCICLYI